MPEYPKLVAPNIWEVEPGWFTFSDETERFHEIQYSIIEAAQQALDNHVYWLNKGETK